MPAHKHAALMAEFAQDAAETETPWERWECDLGSGKWAELPGMPLWSEFAEYRRSCKPRTIRIGEYDVPEPVREPLNKGEEYYMVELRGASMWSWSGDSYDVEWLNLGIIHRTEEAAELHAKALLSFTENKTKKQ